MERSHSRPLGIHLKIEIFMHKIILGGDWLIVDFEENDISSNHILSHEKTHKVVVARLVALTIPTKKC